MYEEEVNNIVEEMTNGANNDIVIEKGIGDVSMDDQGYETEEEIGVPKKGMTFDSVDELFEYYCAYARQKGFEVVKARNKKSTNGELKYVTIACARSGKSRQTADNPLKPQPVKKIHCGAKLNAKLSSEGKWEVNSVIIEHNHVISPSNTRFYPRNRFINKSFKRQLNFNARAGIRLNKSFDSCVVRAKGHENLSFIEKDARNEMEKERRSMLREGDAVAVFNYFAKMQSANCKFFYLMDIDDESRLRNIFWADERSRKSYEEFGDVITFDTTYLTNKYDMPFAPFVGVNHHGQSILLGCGLISREDTESFIWLFDAWLACMGGKAPNGIITDQDRAMQNAINIVFPHSRHRWCLWHIMKKIPEKLKSLNRYDEINIALSVTVYGSLTPEEFEDRWNGMIQEFNLSTHEWLLVLYSERHRWVPCFVKDSFWAGMSTTQRSESINAFFDGYVNSKTTLKQFVEQYENALRSKVEKEKHEDFKSSNLCIPLVSPYVLEENFQKVYTNMKFREFQDEIRALMRCQLTSSQEHDSILECEVREDSFVEGIRRSSHFKVWLNTNQEIDIKCNCRLFEFRGILCKHSLMILNNKNIQVLPNKYILRRWRKDVMRRHTKVAVSYDDWTDTPEWQRFDKMCELLHEVAELAMGSKESSDIVMNWAKEMKERIREHCKISISSQPTHANDIASGSPNILPPLVVRKKGRPPVNRRQSAAEIICKRIAQRKRKTGEAMACETQTGKSRNKGKNGSESMACQKRRGNGCKKNKNCIQEGVEDESNVCEAVDVIGTQESVVMAPSHDSQIFLNRQELHPASHSQMVADFGPPQTIRNESSSYH